MNTSQGVQAYFQLAIAFEDTSRFLSFFGLLCKIFYFIECAYEAKAQMRPKGHSRAAGGRHLFGTHSIE